MCVCVCMCVLHHRFSFCACYVTLPCPLRSRATRDVKQGVTVESAAWFHIPTFIGFSFIMSQWAPGAKLKDTLWCFFCLVLRITIHTCQYTCITEVSGRPLVLTYNAVRELLWPKAGYTLSAYEIVVQPFSILSCGQERPGIEPQPPHPPDVSFCRQYLFSLSLFLFCLSEVILLTLKQNLTWLHTEALDQKPFTPWGPKIPWKTHSLIQPQV